MTLPNIISAFSFLVYINGLGWFCNFNTNTAYNERLLMCLKLQINAEEIWKKSKTETQKT